MNRKKKKGLQAITILSILIFAISISGTAFIGFAADADVMPAESTTESENFSSLNASEEEQNSVAESAKSTQAQDSSSVAQQESNLENESDVSSSSSIVLESEVEVAEMAIEAFAAKAVTDEATLQQQLDLGGSIVLENDITLTTPLLVTQTVELDGAGYSLLLSTGIAGRHIQVSQDAQLTLTNVSLTGNGTGGGVYVESGKLSIAQGTIISANHSSGDGGGVEANGGTVVLAGGTVQNNTAAQNGGGISVQGTAALEIVSGTVAENTAGGFGGGIYAPVADVTVPQVEDISIMGNKAASGAGIYALNANIHGGKISSNIALPRTQAARYTEGLGGGVFAQNQVTITGGVISNNEAGYGGGAYSAGSISISDGLLIENRAFYLYPGNSSSGKTGAGGGLYAQSITMTGGVITSNFVGTRTPNGRASAPIGGGGIAVETNGVITVSGGVISNNDYTGYANGGGVYAGPNSVVIIEGDAKISGNFADGYYIYGGGVHAGKGSTVTIRGNAEISNNVAFQGGGIDIQDKGVLTISGQAQIINNHAMGGSAIHAAMTGNGSTTEYIETAQVFLLGGTISGNAGIVGESNSSTIYGYDITIDGGKIIGNTVVDGYGSAINAYKVTMKSGLVSGNIADGVNGYFPYGAISTRKFFMTGGEISGNGAINTTELRGGGVVVALEEKDVTGEVSIRVSGGTISGNTANYGGGIMVLGNASAKNHTIIFEGGSITGNHSYTGGGGLFFNGLVANKNKVIVENTVIKDNTSDNYGAGLNSSGMDVIVRNGAKITDNIAAKGVGAGLSVYSGATLAVDGSVNPVYITGNKTPGNGGGIYINDLKNLTVNNAVFADNTAGKGFFMTDEADIALYKQQVKDVTLSAPFTEYAYNNFDIIYGKGTLLQYFAVEFNSMGGSSVAGIEKAIYGRGIPAPVPPQKTGYAFEKWTEDQAGTGPAWIFAGENGAMLMPANNLVLYAQWRVANYVVSFESNGGTNIAPQTVNHGGFASRPAAPTKANHTFDGWYSNAGFTSKWDFTSMAVTGNVTLYAKWVAVPASSSSQAPSSSSSVPASSSSSPAASSSSVPASSTPPPAASSSSAAASSSSNAAASSSSASASSSSNAAASSSSASGSASSAASNSSAPMGATSSKPASSSVSSSVSSSQAEGAKAKREETRQELIDAGVPTVEINGTQVPLFGTKSPLVWSLFNLIVTVGSGVIAVVMSVLYIVKRSGGNTATFDLFRLASIVSGLISVIIFFIVSTLTGVMVLFDEWSPVLFIILAIQVLLVVFSRRRQHKNELV